MNRNRAFSAFVILCFVIPAFARAQADSSKTPEKPIQAKSVTPVVDEKPLGVVRQHLVDAVKSMEEALPIYGGPRGKSMAAARQALKAVEIALNVEPPAKKKSAVKEQPVVKPASTKSQVEKIADSQAAMAKGQQELEAAAKELENAKSWIQTQPGANAVKLVASAIADAKASIAVFAKSK
jgi:hypothetical protein